MKIRIKLLNIIMINKLVMNHCENKKRVRDFILFEKKFTQVKTIYR